MDIDIKALSNEYSDKHILVIGDIVLDAYIYGEIDRISQEAPVPIVTINYKDYKPGGAANVAMNLAALGMNVTLSGITGNDDANDQISHMLKKYGIDFQVIIDPKIRTTTKLDKIKPTNISIIISNWQ